MTPAVPRQEAAQEKKVKRREKLKRRGKAEGEQAQPEESGLGDGDLEPPLPKKTKKVKEKSNGLAGESDGSKQALKSSSAGDAAAGEQDSDAEVTARYPCRG